MVANVKILISSLFTGKINWISVSHFMSRYEFSAIEEILVTKVF